MSSSLTVASLLGAASIAWGAVLLWDWFGIGTAITRGRFFPFRVAPTFVDTFRRSWGVFQVGLGVALLIAVAVRAL